MGTKKCLKCEKELPLTEFYDKGKNKKGEIVKISRCKKCTSINPERIKKAKIWREKNKERISQKNKIWYEKNKERIDATHKIWYEKNKDLLKERRKKYYQTHKKEIEEKGRQHYLKKKETEPGFLESQRLRQVKYRQENKERVRQLEKKYYQKNRLEILERRKRYSKTVEGHQKILQYQRKHRAKNPQKRKDYENKLYTKKMKEIYGENWQGRRFRGEALTAKILQDMFPNVKILRGRQGKIEASGNIKKIRKHIYPDFRFILLDKEIIIEYNGGQHYKHIPRMMSVEKFLEIQKRDIWLKNYCEQNNIIFIEIDARKLYYNKNKITAIIQEGLKKYGLYESLDT